MMPPKNVLRPSLARRWPLIAVPLLISVLALAQESPLRLELQRYLVLTQVVEGEERETLVPALELQPGDVMAESLKASNMSDAPLQGLVLLIPIANATSYIEATATTLDLGGGVIEPEFSFDMGQTFGVPPLTRKIVAVEDGVAQEREVVVMPEEYTHVRWVIPSLPPEETITVSIRATVR